MYLRYINASGKVLHGNFNAGTTTAENTVMYSDISMCIKNGGITNLLSLT